MAVVERSIMGLSCARRKLTKRGNGLAELYTIEDGIRGRSADERRAMRQENSRAIVADLEPWLREKLGLISQKTKLAEAIRYTLSRWEGLSRFLEDGRIEIDSNTVERSIRPIALTRR
jgi:transposase